MNTLTFVAEMPPPAQQKRKLLSLIEASDERFGDRRGGRSLPEDHPRPPRQRGRRGVKACLTIAWRCVWCRVRRRGSPGARRDQGMPDRPGATRATCCPPTSLRTRSGGSRRGPEACRWARPAWSRRGRRS